MYRGEPRQRLRNDEHFQCPAVAAQSGFAADVLEAWNWSQDGRSLRDVEPNPSAAMVEGLLLLAGEIDDREKQRQRDRDRDMEMEGGDGAG